LPDNFAAQTTIGASLDFNERRYPVLVNIQVVEREVSAATFGDRNSGFGGQEHEPPRVGGIHLVAGKQRRVAREEFLEIKFFSKPVSFSSSSSPSPVVPNMIAVILGSYSPMVLVRHSDSSMCRKSSTAAITAAEAWPWLAEELELRTTERLRRGGLNESSRVPRNAGQIGRASDRLRVERNEASGHE
jgi:hypothetical protein